MAEDEANKRRRRRKRKKKGNPTASDVENRPKGAWGDDVLVAASDKGARNPNGKREGGGGRRRGRRAPVDLDGPMVSIPSTGRNPHHKRSSRSRRGPPGSAAGRRRRLTRSEVEELSKWLRQLPEPLVANLYRGLGGQPHRVANYDRMIQLTVRAVAQTGRIATLLKSLHERDRKALAALLQAGGLAHSSEFHRELALSFGGQERDWVRTMKVLGEKGVLVATLEQDGSFFYVIPEPLVDGLLQELAEDIALPVFHHSDVKVIDERPFCPPLDFSITTLATYIDQRSPRLTQRHDIYRQDQEHMDAFFSQIWEPNSELFSFHLQFLMMHAMVELRGEYLLLNREVVEEWMQLEPEDQRDLVFRSLERRFDIAEWVLWSIHGATLKKDGTHDGWVAERPLVAVYRRWKRGEDWRERYQRGDYKKARTGERESFSFAPLVRIGLLEMGQWGQEKFYRLSPRGRHLLEPPKDDGFRQFYLTPSFEVMAPAGLAPILLFRIGELAELVGCDRANTYKIAETAIESAITHGWRRDDVLQFLRDNSQIGLPENVEATLKGWIGHRGDVEFHEVTLMTVHRSQIRRLEGNKRIKPYLLHRFAPGMYAVDANKRSEIVAVLQEMRFDPATETRRYPGDPEQVEARQNLHRLLAEARESVDDPLGRGVALVPPKSMYPVPGTKVAAKKGVEPDLPPLVNTDEVRVILDQAMSQDMDVEMVYLAKNGQRLNCVVQPQRLAFKADAPVLVGLDRGEDARRTFVLERVERLRLLEV
jgi:hypothetical protein